MFNGRAAMCDMGNGNRVPQCNLDRAGSAGEAVSEKNGVEDGVDVRVLFQSLLRFLTDERRVVLVHTVQGDPIRGGIGSLRQHFPEAAIRRIHQSRPVQRTHDNGGLMGEEDIPDRFEFVVDRQRWWHQSTQQRVPEGRGDIKTEWGDCGRRGSVQPS